MNAARRSAAVLVLLLCACPRVAPRPKPNLSGLDPFVPADPAPTLELVARSGFTPELFGVYAEDAETGEVLEAVNADRPYAPASATKLLTAGAALGVLGRDFTFRTTLRATGELREGTLNGTLRLVGGGDPTMGDQRLVELAGGLRRAGVKAVQGAFLYDDSALPFSPQIDPGFPLGNDNPALSALSWSGNHVQFVWRPKLGGRGVAWTVPSFDWIAIELGSPDAPPSPEGNLVYAGGTDPEHWVLSPRSPVSGAQYLPLRQPARATASVFRQLARDLGISLPAPSPSTAATEPDRELAAVISPPLESQLHDILLPSDNCGAELVLLSTAAKLAGRPVPTAEAAQLLTAFWKRELPGGAPQLQLFNGSGLNRHNRVTPRDLAGAVRYIEDRAPTSAGTLGLMPISGLRGTIENRLQSPDTALSVSAKTGTLYYAIALAGTLVSSHGRRVYFAAMLSDDDALARVEAGERGPIADKRANAWNARARALIDDWVRSATAKW